MDLQPGRAADSDAAHSRPSWARRSRVGIPVAGSQPLSAYRAGIAPSNASRSMEAPTSGPPSRPVWRRSGNRSSDRLKFSRTMNKPAGVQARPPLIQHPGEAPAPPPAPERPAPGDAPAGRGAHGGNHIVDLHERPGGRAKEAQAQDLLGAVPALARVPDADLLLAQVQRAGWFRDAEWNRALERHGLRVHEDRVVERHQVIRARLVRCIAERDADLAARLVHRHLEALDLHGEAPRAPPRPAPRRPRPADPGRRDPPARAGRAPRTP